MLKLVYGSNLTKSERFIYLLIFKTTSHTLKPHLVGAIGSVPTKKQTQLLIIISFNVWDGS